MPGDPPGGDRLLQRGVVQILIQQKKIPLRQIVADIIGLPLHINEITVGASYGDALMAAIGSGQLSGFQDLEKIIQIKETIRPDPQAHELYRPYREAFRALYLNNRELMHRDGKSFA